MALLSHDDRARIDSELGDILDQARRRYASHPQLASLYDRTAEFVVRGGKRLRPRLCLASYRIMAGTDAAPPRPVVRAAASLELFHAFMLVHDDLIDNCLTRRDRATLHEAIRLDPDVPTDAAGSRHLGLLAGDVLFALGMRTLVRSGLDAAMLVRVQRIVTDMLIETGLGEALDVVYGDTPIDQLTEGQIVESYVRKTSRYTVTGPLVLGATLAGAAPRACRALTRFGDRLGFGYQIRNDLDGLGGDSDGSCPDLDGGKRTLLLWTAHDRLDADGQRLLVETLIAPGGSERREQLLALIDQSQAEAVCLTRLRTAIQQASTALRNPALTPAQRRAFGDLLSWFGLGQRTLSFPRVAEPLTISSAMASGVQR